LLWSVSVAIYERAGRKVPPLSLNLIKGVIALCLMELVLAAQGLLLKPLPPSALGLLALSGFLGLGAGDTFFFAALNRLGTRRTLLFMLAAPPLTALMGRILLAETVSAAAFTGITLTLIGVGWVVTERTQADAAHGDRRRWEGIFLGMLVALTWAGGSVLSRAVLKNSDITPMQSAAVRMAACVLFLVLWGPLHGEHVFGVARRLFALRIWHLIVPATLLGTFLGIYLQQVAFARTDAGIAQTLLSTSPLFGIAVAAVLGERVSRRAVLGALVAFGGILLLCLAKR